MKYFLWLLTVAAAVLTSGCQTQKSAPAKDLVLNAHSRYQIVIPDRHANPGTSKFVRRTAELLRLAFKETLGADFPVVTESRRKAGVKSIFIGNTRVLKAHGVQPLKRFKDFNYGIREFKGNIYLAGADRHRFHSRKPDGSHGSYILGSTRAAVDFMERFLDVRFLYPGEIGIDFVKKEKVVIPANFDYKGVPNLKHMTGRDVRTSQRL